MLQMGGGVDPLAGDTGGGGGVAVPVYLYESRLQVAGRRVYPALVVRPWRSAGWHRLPWPTRRDRDGDGTTLEGWRCLLRRPRQAPDRSARGLTSYLATGDWPARREVPTADRHPDRRRREDTPGLDE